MSETARVGTTSWTERITRAHLPDGRIKDSDAQRVDDPGKPLAALAGAFGRWHYPAGTRFEQLEREVTVTATSWKLINEESA